MPPAASCSWLLGGNAEWLLAWLVSLARFHLFEESANILRVGGPSHLPVHHPVLTFFSSSSLPWV